MASKMTRKWFESMEQFSTWMDSTDGNYDNVVSIVEEGGWYKIDMTTHCARSSTALRRFFGQLVDIKEAYDWKEEMESSAAYAHELAMKRDTYDGSYHLNDMTMGDGSTNPYPMYAYGIENLSDGEGGNWWYIFLNVRTAAGIKEYEDIQDTLRRAKELDDLIPDEDQTAQEIRDAVEVQEQYDEQNEATKEQKCEWFQRMANTLWSKSEHEKLEASGIYDYRQHVMADVISYIYYNHPEETYTNRDDLEEALNEELWCEDSVTGNGSGSYTFDRHLAHMNVKGNSDLVREMAEEFCVDKSDLADHFMDEDWEWFDVSIRCWLLPWAIHYAMDILQDGLFEEVA